MFLDAYSNVPYYISNEEAAAKRDAALTRRSYTRRHLWQPGYVTKPNIVAVSFGISRTGSCLSEPRSAYRNKFTPSRAARSNLRLKRYQIERERSLYTSFHIIQSVGTKSRELKLHAEFSLAEAKGGLLGLERGSERVC